jgi:hypothetical protein
LCSSSVRSVFPHDAESIAPQFLKAGVAQQLIDAYPRQEEEENRLTIVKMLGNLSLDGIYIFLSLNICLSSLFLSLPLILFSL